MLSVKGVRKWKRMGGEDRTPLWRISLFRRWKSSGDPIQGSMKAHVVTHVSLHPCQRIGTASDSGNNATSLWSNLAEKYKKTMLRSQTHAIEAIGIDDIEIVVEVTNAMPSATDRNCNWQLSNAAVEITKSMPSRAWWVTFSNNTWKHSGKVKS